MRLRCTVVAVCAGNACAYAVVNTTPLVLGALMEGLGLDEAAAGILMSAALSTMGIAALASASLLSGARKRRAALTAALILVAGETAAALTDTGTWMTLWMLVIGLGAGVLLAALNAIIAATDAPDRLFGYALTSAYAVAALLVFGLAPAIDLADHHGAYAALAAFSLGSLPLLRGLPQESATWRAVHVCASARMPGGLSLLVGALLAARTGLRLGLRNCILVATLLHTFAIAAAVLSDGLFGYALGTIGEGLSFLFLLPLLFTLAALLDPSGRWAAAANGALFVATGLAPAIVGAVIEAQGYDAIAWLMMAATPLGLVALIASLRALDAHGAAQGGATLSQPPPSAR